MSNTNVETLSQLLGEVVVKIDVDKDNQDQFVLFTLDSGKKLKLYHYQECCEGVWLEDVVGDLDDLIGTPITTAEVVFEKKEFDNAYEYGTWSFYKFATIKGYVDLRFCGESNGYYSETVDFGEVR